ncbi:nuclear transport factor 2 family protein [Streptomyces sp. NPDC059477]|uniref:nuclear transport factor 2 family protein n=1 Tax=Streptomyces sp. NPDC059477 TaxID=3346847 RepID=UPI0036834AD3
MTPRSPLETLKSYFAIESTRDIQGVLDHFSPDAAFLSPGGTRHGRGEIRGYYEESARDYPGLLVRFGAGFEDGTHAALEWQATLTDPRGVSHPLAGTNVVEVRDGLFVSFRTYFDPAALATTVPPSHPSPEH